MANIHVLQVTRFLFCLFITCSAFCYVLFAGALSFDFLPRTAIHISEDASIYTAYQESTQRRHDMEPWLALASFSTNFQFSIARFDGNVGGDGLAFFVAPFHFVPSDAYAGKWLGLFKSETDGNSSNQIVAVEFDTFKNDWDPDDNHVGIDVNSIKSEETFSIKDGALYSGVKWEAWVDYNGTLAQLQVILSQSPNNASPSKPESPVLVYDIDLSWYLPQNVMVGLSASTGVFIETHELHFWKFSCQFSWDSLTPSPAPISYPNQTAQISNPNQTEMESPSSSHSGLKIISIVIGIVCAMVIIVFFVWKRRISARRGERCELGSIGEEKESDEELDKRLERAVQSARKFSYAELRAATNSFSANQEIGHGGFGSVYRGTLCGTNEVVAVKRMNANSAEGKKQYASEVIMNGNLTHRNLVQLLGWCHRKEDRLLVYELLPNGSLDNYLFDNPKGDLEWDKRYIIALDIASGLVYLHQDRRDSVLHRDIKAGNVMLDSEFRAKLGDFGLARALKSEEDYYTTNPAGTIGYMAPELVVTGKASPESDVFSFGALALEIACGKRPLNNSLDEHNYRLVEWVWHLHGEQNSRCSR
ncbi:L-type lectin-domain containing receptor kinase IX.2-like [Cryptomeria japonica]|uniref:L-type lectin-domain containing receptor kinase IX.2-like n=1 Tax=Cryptomeria japonica TaxID=3369 RepID=UPI0027D9F4C2|nr:L-type lectin-domain containing receptor kinase IX.2-like [Cryptomeria japonica]